MTPEPDWSSISSPPARTSPHGDIQPDQNQLNVPTASESRQERVVIGDAEGVTIAPQMDVLRENQDISARPILVNIGTGPQSNDMERSEENVDIIPPVPIRSTRLSLHTDDVVLTGAPRGTSVSVEPTRSSQVRSHNIEGISSIHPMDRGIRQMTLYNRDSEPSYQHEGIHSPRTSTVNRRDSSDSSDNDRFHRERGYANKRGRPPEREVPK